MPTAAAAATAMSSRLLLALDSSSAHALSITLVTLCMEPLEDENEATSNALHSLVNSFRSRVPVGRGGWFITRCGFAQVLGAATPFPSASYLSNTALCDGGGTFPARQAFASSNERTPSPFVSRRANRSLILTGLPISVVWWATQEPA